MRCLLPFLLSFALLVTGVQAANGQAATDTAGGARFAFDETTHNWGRLPADTTLTYRFEFRNTGQTLLMITDVSLSCPCFDVDWNRSPVMPGGRGWVCVVFHTKGKTGLFDKLLWVTSNAVNLPPGDNRFELRIRGEVASDRVIRRRRPAIHRRR